MYHEFDAEAADEAFEELPEVGEEIEHRGDTHIILCVEIINSSALHIKTQKKYDVSYIDDDFHDSKDWDELPERFLNTEPDTNFLENNSLKT